MLVAGREDPPQGAERIEARQARRAHARQQALEDGDAAPQRNRISGVLLPSAEVFAEEKQSFIVQVSNTSTSVVLREKVVPHEVSDDAGLYPRVGRLIGGDDPMGAMSRGHREILGLARKLEQDIAGFPAEGPDPATVREMQRLLYGLEAVLRLHFAQEDEIYHALADGRAEAGASGR